MSIKCYCCSGKLFSTCCEPFIAGIHKPGTAEELMRSRYSAYATVAVEYIMQTTHISERARYNRKSIKEWAESSVWEKLEIISATQGRPEDTTGFVEFKAFYKDKAQKPHVHHEYSTFKKENDSWFFVSGNVY